MQGVLTSEGRTQPGDSEKLARNLGWELHEIETNNSSRLRVPSESVLDQRALLLVPALWAREETHVFSLLGKKVSDFLLSVDQLAGTGALSRGDRRRARVLADLAAGGMRLVGVAAN